VISITNASFYSDDNPAIQTIFLPPWEGKATAKVTSLRIRQRDTILDIDPIIILLEIKFLHNKPPNLQILVHKRKNFRIPLSIRMNIIPNLQIPSRRSTTRLLLLPLPHISEVWVNTFGCSLSENGNPIPFAGARIPNSILPARIPTMVRARIRSRRKNSALI